MRKCALIILILPVLYVASYAQTYEEIFRSKHWIEVGVGFHIRNSMEIIDSNSNSKAALSKIGYKYWGEGKFGLGFDLVFGDVFVNIPDAINDFHEQVLEGVILANYKLVDKRRFIAYLSSGLGIGSFSHLSRQNTEPEFGTQVSIPIQLGLQYSLSRLAGLSLQVNRKNYFSEIPDYFQISLSLSIGL
jgi:hypothetical protein